MHYIPKLKLHASMVISMPSANSWAQLVGRAFRLKTKEDQNDHHTLSLKNKSSFPSLQKILNVSLCSVDLMCLRRMQLLQRSQLAGLLTSILVSNEDCLSNGSDQSTQETK